MYIYDSKDWPHFKWNQGIVLDILVPLRHRQGLLIGRMGVLGFNLRKEAVLQSITQDVMKSSEIEGEILDKSQVRSSIARRLGIEIGGLENTDRNVEGVVEIDEGNMPEVYEYWAVTSWFAEKLKAQGELVAEFFDLVIWGRQTTGQAIYAYDGGSIPLARSTK